MQFVLTTEWLISLIVLFISMLVIAFFFYTGKNFRSTEFKVSAGYFASLPIDSLNSGVHYYGYYSADGSSYTAYINTLETLSGTICNIGGSDRDHCVSGEY